MIVLLGHTRKMALSLAMAAAACSGEAAAQRRLVPLEQLVTDQDLPVGILSPGAYAEVTAELAIDGSGQVKNCRTTYANNPKLRSLTCILLKQRARYAPAYDKVGKGKPSRDMITVYWGAAPAKTMVGLVDYGGAWPSVPEEVWLAEPFKNHMPKRRGSALVRYQIGIDGHVGACAIVAVNGDALVAKRLCEALQRTARFRPPVDEKGEPYAVTGSLKYDWLGTDDIPAAYRR